MRFIVNITTADSALLALFLLSNYMLHTQILSDSENHNSTKIVVFDEFRGGDFRLAEMAFQMNFKQVGTVCFVCEGEQLHTCEHLTFEGVI